MKFPILIISIIFLIASVKTNGQVIITKNDSIPFGADSIAIIQVPNYRGNISWQLSFDRINWFTSDWNYNKSLAVSFNNEAYYRAVIVDGDCTPVYSDTVKIIVPDSVKTIFGNNSIQLAYPDSVGVLVTFIRNDDTIVCQKINGEYIYQGDIILTPTQLKRLSSPKSAGITDGFWFWLADYWPNNTVYYTMEDRFKVDNRILGAIKHWEEKTSLKFIKTDESGSQKDYIKFVWDAQGCNSQLGMIGGKQEIRIADWGEKGDVIHEIGHAIGLIHEQSRNDRDKYINVHFDNITPDWQDQFKIYSGNTVQTQYFDFGSIMIYSGVTKSTLVAIDPSKPIMTKWVDGLPWVNQKNGLSNSDIIIIGMMYPPLYPSVITKTPTSITPYSAICGGIVISQGISPVIECGVCWNTSGSPTILDNFTSNGAGKGDFTSSLNALTANTSYCVRAYATNNQGTSYGNQLTFTTTQSANQTGTFTDSRDNKTYNWVKIGDQTWMAENLAYLPSVVPPSFASETKPYYYVYNFYGTNVAAAKANSNYSTYGVLYNLPAAILSCPSGWHLPSQEEWLVLTNYVFDKEGSLASKSLAAKYGWIACSGSTTPGGEPESNNSSGFSALPGGLTWGDDFGSVFLGWDLGKKGFWWSTTPTGGNEQYYVMTLYNDYPYYTPTGTFVSPMGLSVRCVKN